MAVTAGGSSWLGRGRRSWPVARAFRLMWSHVGVLGGYCLGASGQEGRVQ